MSTGSGLPDYRGRDAVPRFPMTYQEIMGSDRSRRRYWARSTVGWKQFGRARPSPGHLALAEIAAGAVPVTGVVTQHVGGLPPRVGPDPVNDLHRRLVRV